jgi:hypothetical protein
LTRHYDELYEHASSQIRRSREMTQMLMQDGFILPAPAGDA